MDSSASPFASYFAEWLCDPGEFSETGVFTPIEFDPLKNRMRSYVMKKVFLPPLKTSLSLDLGKKLKDVSNRHLSTAGVLHVPSRGVSFNEKIVMHYYEKEKHIQSSPSH